MKIVTELVGGICNSKCVWCFLNYKCRDRMQQGMMSYENFVKFIDLNRGSKMSLIPFGHGESLLNKDFPKCYKYALAAGFRLSSVHTNLALPLSDEEIKAMCLTESITVNFGGGTKSTQFINMQTDLDLVLSNLSRLMSFNPRKVSAKMVINKFNVAETDLLTEKVHSISKSIDVGFYPIYFGPADSDEEDKRLFYDMNFDENIKLRDTIVVKDDSIEVAPKRGTCYGLITTVRWNGEVAICCRERYSEKSVGNAFETPISEIVASNEYKEAVELGKKRQWVKYCEVCS